MLINYPNTKNKIWNKSKEGRRKESQEIRREESRNRSLNMEGCVFLFYIHYLFVERMGKYMPLWACGGQRITFRFSSFLLPGNSELRSSGLIASTNTLWVLSNARDGGGRGFSVTRIYNTEHFSFNMSLLQTIIIEWVIVTKINLWDRNLNWLFDTLMGTVG